MKIEHVALWARELEAMKAFYCRHFGCAGSQLYHNPRTGFRSYFLTFESGARLELMNKPSVAAKGEGQVEGWAHLALSVGSEAEVIATTQRLAEGGVRVISQPRRTGDGYFESVVLDPEGNEIEITI